MANAWFKFYGLDYLTDSKLMEFDPIEKTLWVTILCVASSEDKGGIIPRLTMDKLFKYANIFDMETREKYKGFLQKIKLLSMITIDNENDNNVCVITFKKHQNTQLSGYERVKKYRIKKERQDSKKTHNNDNENDNVHDNENDNARVDKRRIEKNREEKNRDTDRVTPSVESNLDYLKDLPVIHVAKLSQKYDVPEEFVRSKAEDLWNYCKYKGKSYKDYHLFLANAIREDKGKSQSGKMKVLHL